MSTFASGFSFFVQSTFTKEQVRNKNSVAAEKKKRLSDLLCFQEVPVPHESKRNVDLGILGVIG